MSYTYYPRLASAVNNGYGGQTGACPDVDIVLVGAGGTGGRLARLLASTIYHETALRRAGHVFPASALASRELRLHIVDPDLFEETNIGRQDAPLEAAVPRELPKAEVTALRLQDDVGFPIAFYVEPFRADGHYMTRDDAALRLVIGCVDNLAARRAMHEALGPDRRVLLMDIGNGRDFGQILLGDVPTRRDLAGAFSTNGLCSRLPAPGLARPALITREDAGEREGERHRQRDCARRVIDGEQDLDINAVMAAHAMRMVRLLLEGRLTYWDEEIDMAAGTIQRTEISPVAVAESLGVSIEELGLVAAPGRY